MFTHGFGIEGQLIFHWICERDLDIDVVTLDTGRLFPETYELWAETERRYGRRIRAIYPDRAALERLVAKQGIDGIYESKRARDSLLRRAQDAAARPRARGAAAWITGLRADQNDNRRDAGFAGFDGARGLLKFNPLFDWTREAVLAETQRLGVPINALHAKGFASIGCAPCTRAIKPANRNATAAGGGKADGHKECGLHLPRRRAGKDNLTPRPRRDERRLRLNYFPCIARQMRSGVAGISMCVTPNSVKASTTALTTAGSAPTQPASPAPLTPSGLVLVGTGLLSTCMAQKSCACGMA